MAIRYEEMPEENQRRAIDIFARQQRGEISQAEAERQARANESDAQNRRNSGASGGSFLITQPSSGGGGGGGGGNQGKPGESGDTAVCGPKPTTSLRPGESLVCNRQTRQWEVIRDPGAAYRPSTEVGQEEVPLEEMPLAEFQQAQLEAQRQSAKAIINALLEDYDLGGLSDFVEKLIFKEDIMDARAILARIRTDKGAAGDTYWARFAGNRLRRDAGFNALSEAEYLAMENTYRQIMRASGLPTGFYDAPEDFSTLIGGDVSPAELNSRISDGYQAVAQSNPQVINEMRRLYGVDDSMLAAYFLDPAKATPMLLRQARAAQIASEATLQAQQQIGAGTAEELAVAGVTQEQARQGFQTIGAAQELFVALPGTTEEAITQEEQIAGVFGTSGAAQQRIRQRQRQRQAAFEAGGRFAGQGTTVTGLQ